MSFLLVLRSTQSRLTAPSRVLHCEPSAGTHSTQFCLASEGALLPSGQVMRALRKAQTSAYALDSKGFGAHRDRTYLNQFQ